jgi:hypothetical protein
VDVVGVTHAGSMSSRSRIETGTLSTTSLRNTMAAAMSVALWQTSITLTSLRKMTMRTLYS